MCVDNGTKLTLPRPQAKTLPILTGLLSLHAALHPKDPNASSFMAPVLPAHLQDIPVAHVRQIDQLVETIASGNAADVDVVVQQVNGMQSGSRSLCTWPQCGLANAHSSQRYAPAQPHYRRHLRQLGSRQHRAQLLARAQDLLPHRHCGCGRPGDTRRRRHRDPPDLWLVRARARGGRAARLAGRRARVGPRVDELHADVRGGAGSGSGSD